MYALPLTDTAQLRPLEPWQGAEFAEFIERSRDHLDPWLPWVNRITDEETASAWLQTYADHQAADTGRIYGIWLENTLVGGLVFRTFDARVGVCEIGAWLSPEAEGHGLVHRAVRELMRWAFEERAMNRVEWYSFTDNLRSIAAAERLGMTYEGTRREAFTYRGKRRDFAVLAVLADEWNASLR